MLVSGFYFYGHQVDELRITKVVRPNYCLPTVLLDHTGLRSSNFQDGWGKHGMHRYQIFELPGAGF